jgi:hypothetical protein
VIYPIFSILITILFFGIIIKSIFKKIGIIELLGISFLIGIGLESIILFVIFSQLDLVNAQIYWWIKAAEGISVMALFLIKRPKLILRKECTLKSIISWSGLFWLGILLLFTLSLIYTLYYPVYTTDSLYYFDFRSKIMFLSHSVSGISIIPNWSYYPMFTSMVGLISRLSGSDNPSFYYPIMFLSFALIFYSSLRRFSTRNIASIFTLLMYSTPLLYWQSRLDGMTNLPYAIFLGTGFIYAIDYLITKKENSQYYLFFSILALGLSRWVRIQEPFWMIPLIPISIKLVWNKNFLNLLLGILLFYSICSIWPNYISKTFNKMHGKNTTVSAVGAIKTLSVENKKILSTIGHVSSDTSITMYQSLSPISVLFIISLVFLPLIEINYPIAISLYFIFGSWALIIISTLYGSFVWSWMLDLQNSLSRLSSFFVPLIWYYFSVFLNRIISKFKMIKLIS